MTMELKEDGTLDIPQVQLRAEVARLEKENDELRALWAMESRKFPRQFPTGHTVREEE